MSAKKNLTVTVLIALLAMSAFGTVNVNASSYHFDNAHNNPVGNAMGKIGYTSGPLSSIHSFNYNGHHFTISAPYASFKGIVTSLDGDSNATNAQIQAALTGASLGSNSGQNKNITGTSNNDNSNDSQSQYQNRNTNNNKLVQTGEDESVNKVATIGGDIALAASASLAALSFAKKHRNLIKEDITTDTTNVIDSDGNNKFNYSNKSNYDMIMSSTFAKLSKNLKNM